MKFTSACAAVAAVGLLGPARLSADEIIKWNNEFLNSVRATSMNPNRTTRAAAMLHTAMYDAINSIAQTHQPYHVNLMADPGASREAAAAQAAHRVLSSLFPTRQAVFTDALNATLDPMLPGPAKTAGINLGNSVGDAILALRANDHAGDVVSYTPGSNPGDWIPTPPGFAAALLPNWQIVTPWAMTSGSQFRDPNGPPALDSAEYTANFLEVKAIGSAASATRTADQSAIARFWASSAGTSTPPGHWMRIAQTVADAQGNTLEDNARMFALLTIGMADASISSWDNKFTYNDWRPITAIRAADTDGNLATEADVSWNSFLTTPNHPSYTSNHSSVSGAAGVILADFFGTDNITFTTSSEGVVLPDRTFTSFSQASAEAADSRLYGGIHWRYDNEDGLVGGRAVGSYVFDTQLQPIPEPSCLILLALAVPALRRRRTPNTGSNSAPSRRYFGMRLCAITCLVFVTAEADARNILVVSDFTTDVNIASVLIADGHTVTIVTNDYVTATQSNPTLQNPLSAYHAVYWSAGESNFGSLHGDASTFANLTSYVNNGGRVFVTGADSVADPSDPNMVAFLGGSGTALDTTSSPGAVVNAANSLTTGVVDIRGVTPTGGGVIPGASFSDLDAVRNLGADTVGVVPSGTAGSWQWTLRKLGRGEIAFVSNGSFDFSPLDTSWENTAAGGVGAYNAAIRNFAVPEPGPLALLALAAPTLWRRRAGHSRPVRRLP